MKNDTLKKTARRLVRFLALMCLTGNIALAATQTDIADPADSGRFGQAVIVLSNGNIVVARSEL